MGHFIKLCVAVILLSFVAVPVYYGVSKEHDKIISSNSVENTAISSNTALSFDDIYALARENEAPLTPEDLNNILPAAGEASLGDSFSSGFSETTQPNL